MKVSRYAYRFYRHVLHFMDRKNLWPKRGGRALVALSGGADSICLVHLLARMQKERNLRVLAVNVDHQTGFWGEQAKVFCRQQCESLGIPFASEQLLKPFAGNGSNREQRWRKGRRALFERMAREGDRVYQGHHLNDSFEWYLMGKLKSSCRDIPGIACHYGIFHRPLLSVSRSQIETFLKSQGVPFLKDPSNKDMSLERNQLRQSISSWQETFPKYLKHYALSQNALYGDRGGLFSRFQDAFGGLVYWPWQNPGERTGAGAFLRKALIEGIRDLSCRQRGVLSKEVDKLLEAVERRKKLGPMVFSGGVLAYWESPMIYLINERQRKEREQRLQSFSLGEKTYRDWEEFRDYYRRFPENLTLPLLISSEKKSLKIPENHPLYGPFTRKSSTDRVWTSPPRLLGRALEVSWPLKVERYTYPMDVSRERM